MKHFSIVLPFLFIALSSFGAATPPLNFALPEGGEVFVIGTNQFFQNAGRRSFKTIKVELSRDGGVSYETLGVINNMVKDRSIRNKLPWHVEGPASSNCIARLTGKIGKFTYSALSSPFSIEGPETEVTQVNNDKDLTDTNLEELINALLNNPAFISAVTGPVGPPGQSIQGPVGPPGPPANAQDIVNLLIGDSQFYLTLEQVFLFDPDFLQLIEQMLASDQNFQIAIKNLLKLDVDFVAACKGDPGKDGKDGLPVGSSGSVAITLTGAIQTVTVNNANCHAGSVVLVTFVDLAGKVSTSFSVVVKNVREGAFDVVVRNSGGADIRCINPPPAVPDAVNFLILNNNPQ